MNCVIYCSSPISHIVPLKQLINYFISKKINVYCFTVKSNKNLIVSLGAKFMEYPFDFETKNNQTNILTRSKTFNNYMNSNKIVDAYKWFVVDDTESFYTHTFENLINLTDITKAVRPDFIIRDAVDRYGSLIAQILSIPCIGLITHSLYSVPFFNQDPTYYYRVFMNAINKEGKEVDEFFRNFRAFCEYVNNDVFLKSSTFKINTHHQFDPKEYITLIYTLDIFQPKESLENERKYFYLYPDKTQFLIEKEIKQSLQDFMINNKKNNTKMVYIASGSMIAFPLKIYIQLIDGLLKNNFSIIVSNKHQKNELISHFDKNNMVYIDDYIPQQYVLSLVNLFIMSGGQNSILESIYHKVPMLVIPLTSEQRLNGLIIDKNKIGRTTYIDREDKKTVGQLIDELVTNNIYKTNLKRFHDNLVLRKDDLNDFWKVLLDEKLKKKV